MTFWFRARRSFLFCRLTNAADGEFPRGEVVAGLKQATNTRKENPMTKIINSPCAASRARGMFKTYVYGYYK